MQILKRVLAVLSVFLMVIVPCAALALDENPALDAQIDKKLKNTKAPRCLCWEKRSTV